MITPLQGSKELKGPYYAYFQVHHFMLCFYCDMFICFNVHKGLRSACVTNVCHYFTAVNKEVCGRETPSVENFGILAFADHLHAHKPI